MSVSVSREEMNREEVTKSKAKNVLPLKSGAYPLKDQFDTNLSGNASNPTNIGNISNNPKKQAIHDVLGSRNERRDCAVGVRVTREMKDILENLAAETRMSESEIAYRLLNKCLSQQNLNIL